MHMFFNSTVNDTRFARVKHDMVGRFMQCEFLKYTSIARFIMGIGVSSVLRDGYV